MRVLCLHGHGASGRIMESQIGSLRALLPSTYEYDYLDAPHDSEPAPELKTVYPGPNYCFFERYSPANMEEAIEYVGEVIEEDGPFDCIMGFSQGAAVAAAFIAQSLSRDLTHRLRLAVFICAALVPPSVATEKNVMQTIGSLGTIDIPTVHIIGQMDPCSNQSVQLARLCTSSMAHIIFHRGGHDVPRDGVNCSKIAGAIARCTRLAFARH